MGEPVHPTFRRRRGRLFAAAACGLLVAAAVAGCSSGPAGPPVLNFYTPADNASGYAAGAEACTEAANGRYVVTQQTLPKAADDQRLQLARRLVAGDPEVDLMTMDVTWTAEFAEAGWIEPWPEDRAAQVAEGTLEGPLETARYQGQLWGAPLNTNTQLLWYRTDLAPQPPQTWDEMIQMSEALHEQDLPSYIETQAAQYEGISVWFNTLLTSAGGQLVSEDGEVLVDDGDAAHRATSIMQRVASSPVGLPASSMNVPPPPPSGGGVLIEALTNG